MTSIHKNFTKVLYIFIFCLTSIVSSLFMQNKAYAVRMNPDDTSYYLANHNEKVSSEALFNLDGTINTEVRDALFTMLQNIQGTEKVSGVSTYPDGYLFSGPTYTETTGYDFSEAVKGNADSGIIIIKLFETYDTDNNYVDDFTSQWFQLVYRSTDENNDVLTLLMAEPYRLSYANNNLERTMSSDYGNDSANYFSEGNYTQSIVRTNLLKDYHEIETAYPQISTMITTPSQLPGLWQSSAEQTAELAPGLFYKNDPASGAISHNRFINGMDGLSLKIDDWQSEVVSNYSDKLWLPSSYELTKMGEGKENLPYSAIYGDENATSYTNSYTGLWKMNAYSRAYTNNIFSLTRTAYYTSYYQNILDQFSVITNNGSTNITSAASQNYQQYYVRPALHIDLSALSEYEQEPDAEYTITWKKGAEYLEIDTGLQNGNMPIYDGATPMKSSTSQFDYTFIGWNIVDTNNTTQEVIQLQPITEDTTYYAIFSQQLRSYTVVWRTFGETVFEVTEQEYGTVPIYLNGEIPTKNSTVQFEYTFIGWNTVDTNDATQEVIQLQPITEDITYYAIFSQQLRHYTIVWRTFGDTVFEVTEQEYGTVPIYLNGETPTKNSTAQFDYTFIGWNTVDTNDTTQETSVITAITADTTLYAIFSKILRSYSVTWKNYDGSVLLVKTISYGSLPEYTVDEPIRESDENYFYTFSGWDKTYLAVTGNEVYTAIFEKHLNYQEINILVYIISGIGAVFGAFGILGFVKRRKINKSIFG